MSKFRKILKNIRGSEVVEKILMTVTAIIICGLGIAYMNKVMTAAIKDAGGDKLTNEQIILPDNNTQPPKPSGTITIKEELIGTWVFNETLDLSTSGDKSYLISFTSNNENFILLTEVRWGTINTNGLAYSNNKDIQGTFVYNEYNQNWSNLTYRIITITDVSQLTNEQEFISFMNSNATKQGGTQPQPQEEINLLGTWKFNEILTKPLNAYLLNFELPNVSGIKNFYKFQLQPMREPHILFIESYEIADYEVDIYDFNTNKWLVGEEYRTIKITNINDSMLHKAEFTDWLKSNAVKQA